MRPIFTGPRAFPADYVVEQIKSAHKFGPPPPSPVDLDALRLALLAEPLERAVLERTQALERVLASKP